VSLGALPGVGKRELSDPMALESIAGELAASD
jgi:hypothetical protein